MRNLNDDSIPLEALILESKDGEWGKGEAFRDSVEMTVIRGTDFQDVRDGNIKDIPVRFIEKNISQRKTIKPNDIIIETAGGTSTQPTGRTVFISKKSFNNFKFPITCASFSRFIRLRQELANPNYIYWYLQFLYNNDILRQYHTQHTGVARFQWTTFSKTKLFKLPELNIQEKIASILSAYDELVENNNKRIKILEKIAQEIYKEWFVRFRFPGHENTKFEKGLPEGWKFKKLKDIVKTQYGFTASAEFNSEIGPKFLRITDIAQEQLIWEEVPYCKIDDKDIEKYKLNHGDIVIARTGATAGYAKLIIKPPKSIFASYLVRLLPKDKKDIFIIGIVIESNDYKNFIQSVATGAAQPQANAELMTLFTLLLPSDEIKNKFNSIVNPLFEEKEILKNQNQNLKKSRDLLLPRLISGKLSVESLDKIEPGKDLVEV